MPNHVSIKLSQSLAFSPEQNISEDNNTSSHHLKYTSNQFH